MAVAALGCSKSNAENSMNNSFEKTMEQFANAGYAHDTFTTASGRHLGLIFIKHGSIALDIDGYVVYIDPVGMFGNDFSVLPKADLVLITHEHHDHLDPTAVAEIASDSTAILGSGRVAELFAKASPLKVGETREFISPDFSLTTVPAYNITPEHLQFHPRERADLGFVFTVDNLKIYVAGDTEDIPEMANLKEDGIDIAFLPVNQPYTMTPQQAIHAVEMIEPKIVYPYHYGQTDLTPLVDAFSGSNVDIRVRQLQ